MIGCCRSLPGWILVSILAIVLSAESSPPKFKVAEGFQVEQVYSVPETQGSWVALCVDDKGRLIAGDQDGGLYRVELREGEAASVDPLNLEIGHANGLCYAFGSLYVVVAEDEYEGGGLYRIRDLDGDDAYDEVQYLRDFVAKGEHGPHSVIPGPNGRWLYVISGNKTPLPKGPGFKSLVPEHWGEDDLLPRIWGPIGSEKGTTAPGGWIARTDPDGKQWELLAIGLRNGFDIAFNEAGDLFTTDADAEFDMNTPWYQPTRLLHVVTGTDFGWRSGSGKWQPYFADTIPPVYEYGPGSPTGITFGYGARFPERYQNALFACDWSWGRIFVSWLQPNGGSYSAQTEEFLTGVPLPVADIVVNPSDGAMYFTLGGRGTTSGLYRITYTGSEREAERTPILTASTELRGKRQQLEGRIESASEQDASYAWPYLGSDDPVVRHTARLLLEQIPSEAWKKRAFSETDPIAQLTALLGLARKGKPTLLPEILDAVLSHGFDGLSKERTLLSLRCLEVAFIRMGSDDTRNENAAEMQAVKRELESLFPANDTQLDGELIKLLVYLQSAKATPVAMDLMEKAVTQEDALRYMLPLRVQSFGWTESLRERFFRSLGKAHGWTGGRSLSKYVETIVEDALNTVPEGDRMKYREIVEEARPKAKSGPSESRSFVKLWKLGDLLPISEDERYDGDPANGREAFTAAGCFACHRVDGEGGGSGPDLSAVMRRFSVADFLEAVIEPSKVISDQFGMSVVRKTDGSEVHGKVVNYYGESIGIQTDPLNAAEVIRIPRKEIASLEASPVSPMPPALLSTLTRKDILDMIAYLKSESR